MRRVKNTVVVLIIGLCVAAFTIVDIAHAKGGLISGHVYEADGQTPIEGARVRGVSVISTKESTTDANGFYILKEMSPNVYLIEVSAVGYVSASKGNVSVTENYITGNINFILLSGSSISGSIFSVIDSSTLEGAKIIASNNANHKTWQSISKEDGTYSMFGIIPGNYTILASLDGFANSYNLNVIIERGIERKNVNLSLGIGGSVSGTILASDGVAGISGATICLYNNNENIKAFYSTVSEVNGQYLIEQISLGDYSVLCSIGGNLIPKETLISITHNSLMDNINFVNPINMGSVSGIVTQIDGVTPIPDAVVAILSDHEAGAFDYVETDADGKYLINDLAARSDYEMICSADGFLSLVKQDISIVENVNVTVNFALESD